MHRLARSSAAEAQARALMERIRVKGSLDVDCEGPADPRFAAEQLYKPGGGKMLGVLLAAATTPPNASDASSSQSGGDGGTIDGVAGESVVVLKAFSGQMYGEWILPGQGGAG